MRTVEDIIALLGGPEAAAQRCSIGTEAVRKWRQARAIPPRHWPAILAATGLSLAELPGAPETRAETTMPQTETAPDAVPERAHPTARPPAWSSAMAASSGARGFGAHTPAGAAPVAEVCFNTGMTGYQETLTDPSYAGQIITFTFPHIGNVGTNPEDLEATTPVARGLVVKQDLTEPANYRSTRHLDAWLKSHDVPGIAGIDTRALTLRIRDGGAPNGVLCFPADGQFDLAALRAQAAGWPGLEGMDLAKEVSCRQAYALGRDANGPGRQASAGRPRRSTRSSRWITGRSATSCAAWPPPAST